MSNNKHDIKVSVCVVTYNQADYISQCLQSLVDQATNFGFEIIVGDDCSTDGTSKIVEGFQKRYPELVKPIFHEKNVGASRNFESVHSQAKGKYVAHIDGDDYMLPQKLQTQADFMDLNPDCNISWHKMFVQYADNKVEDFFDFNKLPKEGFSRAGILKYMAIGMNSSKMYRANTMNFERPDFPMIDYFANVEQVGSGYATYVVSEPLGVYRSGIGIAKNDYRVKEALNESFLYFLIKYPNCSKEINQAVLLLLLLALKNKRYKEIALFSKAYFTSFSFSSFVNLWKDYDFIKSLRLPK